MPSPATHLRAPLLWLLLPLMAGLTAAKLWPPPGFGLWPLALAAGGLSLAAIWLALRPGKSAGRAWALCLTLAGGLSGFALLHARQPQLHEWTGRPPREVTVTLEVLQTFPPAPQARSLTGLGRIVATGGPDRELLDRRVYYSAIRRISVPPQRSGRYLVQGVIEPMPREPAEASFNDYLENLGIRQKLTRAHIQREAQPPGWFRRFCSRAEDRLEAILQRGLQKHPQTLSLYLGMLLGEKAVLSDEQQNAFMRSGTFHIFSISGLHVGVIAVALQCMLRLLRMPRRPAVVLSLLMLWLYVQITGASSPAERSFIMIAFLLATQVFRLPGNPLAALAAAALVTLLLDPLQLFSTGFQMSYAVVVALVVMGLPLGEKWLAAWRPFSLLPKPNWRWYHHTIDWSGRWLLGSSAVCWAAFLASTPSGIGYFHVFSPGSLVANLVVIPVSSLALIAGFLSLLTGLAGLLSLSMLFNSAAAVTLLLMDWLVRHGTELPGVYFAARFASGWMAPVSLVGMTAVMLAGLSGRWSRRYGGYWPPAVALGLMLIFWVKFG
jgi:competence protein ComEC